MKIQRYFAILCCLLVLPLLITGYLSGDEKKKKTIKDDACSASNPASICAAANTCGSASTPCSIDIKRSQGSFATATPSIPGAKSNKPFCIKVGTSVTFMSTSKNTGVVIDFGATSPFDNDGAVQGGAANPITVVAKRAGCYTYSVGACTAGTIYGMCGQADVQFIVSAN